MRRMLLCRSKITAEGWGGGDARPAPATDGLSCRHKLTQPLTEADGAERVGVAFKEGRGREASTKK